jgi:hypothetical protein
VIENRHVEILRRVLLPRLPIIASQAHPHCTIECGHTYWWLKALICDRSRMSLCDLVSHWCYELTLNIAMWILIQTVHAITSVVILIFMSVNAAPQFWPSVDCYHCPYGMTVSEIVHLSILPVYSISFCWP